MMDLPFPQHLILASASPRRQQLLKEAGFTFDIVVRETDESYPPHLKREEVALHIARNKMAAFDPEVNEGATVITADTIVCLGDLILGKPTDLNDAERILKLLSGNTHTVITAVCIRNVAGTDCFHVSSEVEFRPLTQQEITYYLNHYAPFDKAGAYGIQEWIGLVAIRAIRGSYHNVMGLPVSEVYAHLMNLKR